LRTPTLQIDGEAEQPGAAPLRHRPKELACVALRVPLASVGIGPFRASRGIRVVEDALDHARVHQEAFDPHALVRTTFVGWPAVDQKPVPVDGDLSLRPGA